MYNNFLFQNGTMISRTHFGVSVRFQAIRRQSPGQDDLFLAEPSREGPLKSGAEMGDWETARHVQIGNGSWLVPFMKALLSPYLIVNWDTNRLISWMVPFFHSWKLKKDEELQWIGWNWACWMLGQACFGRDSLTRFMESEPTEGCFRTGASCICRTNKTGEIGPCATYP